MIQTGEAVKKQKTFIKGNEARKYHVNDITEDDFWQVVKEEKLQEGDFDVESSMSFTGSHWCRPTPRDEHRMMEWDEHRSTLDVQDRSTESVASCQMVRIMTHEELPAKRPHPPKPYHTSIGPMRQSLIDRETQPTMDKHLPALINEHLSPTECNYPKSM